LAEFERATCHWPDAVLSEAVVRMYLSQYTGVGRLHRLTVIRALAKFLVLEQPETFVPPRRFLGIRQPRVPIRVLSRDEARRFLLACDALPDITAFPRGVVYGTAMRTLLLTGLRRGELISLRDQDVDLVERVVTVRCGKFGKSRLVPISPDLADRFRTCREMLASRIAKRELADAFFRAVSTDILHLLARVVVPAGDRLTSAVGPHFPRGVERRERTADDPPMLTTTGRAQQRYDHRLRELVQVTGDVTIAPDSASLARRPVGGSARLRRSW
jgi:integrase